MATAAAFYRLGLVAAADYALAAALYPALRWSARRRIVAQTVLILALVVSPVFIPRRAKLLRMIAGMTALAIMIKTYDAGATAGATGEPPPPRQYLAHLPNALWVVCRRKPAETAWSRQKNLNLLLCRAAGAAVATAVCVYVFKHEWRGRSFWTEHIVKVIPFYFTLINATGAVAATWRLAGGMALDMFDHPAFAATPADFWRRWNRPTAQWFHEHVFGPAGGWARPVGATLMAFVVSAIVHEYLFSITIGRVQGFQTAFFTIHGLAAAATLRLRPRGWRRALWTAGTFVFTLATSVLFFASLNHVVRMYDRPLPGWLGRWDQSTSQ